MNDIHLSAIHDFDKHVIELEEFLARITDNKYVSSEWSALWKTINRFVIEMTKLERKWKGYKQVTKHNPIPVISKDLNQLVGCPQY